MPKSRATWQWINLRPLIFIALLIPSVSIQPARAASSPQFQEFPAPLQVSSPSNIITEPGGDIWFTEATASILGRFSTKNGLITSYQTGGSAELPIALIDAGDSTLWLLTKAGLFEHIFPNTGQILSYSDYPFLDMPYLIARGGDGNLWFVTEKTFGHIATDGTGIVELRSSEDAQHGNVISLIAGPDGNLWYSLKNGSIGKITPQGDTSEYPLSSKSLPIDLQLGPDGNLWFLDQGTGSIGSITFQGSLKTYPVPPTYHAQDWTAMTLGQNGQFWFTDPISNQLISRNSHGHFASYAIPTFHSKPGSISSDTHGTLWFSETGADKIASFTPPTIPNSQQANTTLFQEIPVPGTPVDPLFILPGPGGDLWFSEGNTTDIGRITTNGQLLPSYHTPEKYQGYTAVGAMARGKDGNLWFVEDGTIERMTPSGKVNGFPPPDPNGLSSLSANSDGNLWFLSGRSRVGKITPQGKITKFSFPHFSSQANPNPPFGTIAYLTAGPDGNLWFTEYFNNLIGRVTQQGKLHEYRIPPETPLSGHNGSEPTFITSGPGGRLWFLETGYNVLGSITPQGVFHALPVNEDFTYVNSINFGYDGNLWLTTPHKIVRITLQGLVTEYLFGPDSDIVHITAGPDGNLWFTDAGTHKIGKIILPTI